MDILNYSPKSMSDMSVASNEQRMSTPLSNCTDTNISSNVIAMTKIDANSLNGIERKENRNPNETENKSSSMPYKQNEFIEQSTSQNLTTSIETVMATANSLGLSNNDAAYVDEFYRKISEYYRGIFSNIDIKDPNISADVLNYYQLIRQFYEQTMAINIQRNTALGLGTLTTETNKIDAATVNAEVISPQINSVPTLATSTQNDISTIDLTIHKPTPNETMTFNNIKNNNSFQNNININIGSANDADIPTKKRPIHENLSKMNETHPVDDVTENKVTISSAGVSINVSSLNSNSLKISCKTTPPKKRYSVYNHSEDVTNVERTAQKSLPHTTPINLNRKFDVDSLATKRSRNNTNSNDDNILTKSNFAVDALKTGAMPLESNKSSPSTNVDSMNSITDIIPITSTYLQLMRSMGFTEEDALKFDNLVSFFFSFWIYKFIVNWEVTSFTAE